MPYPIGDVRSRPCSAPCRYGLDAGTWRPDRTRPEFVYVHEWTPGDLIVWDNRCLVHAATWFDADTEARVMWRTTVSGNPGAAYAGENKSWVAAA